MRRLIPNATLSVVYRVEGAADTMPAGRGKSPARPARGIVVKESERNQRWLKATVLATGMAPRGDSSLSSRRPRRVN